MLLSIYYTLKTITLYLWSMNEKRPKTFIIHFIYLRGKRMSLCNNDNKLFICFHVTYLHHSPFTLRFMHAVQCTYIAI